MSIYYYLSQTLFALSYRDIKNIDITAFSCRTDSLPSRDNLSTPDKLVSYYSDGLHSLLNTFHWKLGLSISFTLVLGLLWIYANLKLKIAWNGFAQRLVLLSIRICIANMWHYKDALSAVKSEYYAVLMRSGEGNTRTLYIKPPDNFPPQFYCTEH